MAEKRTRDEGRRIVEEYEVSGMTRREFCRRTNIPVTTLDYWRQRRAKGPKPRLLEVTVMKPEVPLACTVVLVNGRRIEVPENFHESVLSSLIRVVESA